MNQLFSDIILILAERVDGSYIDPSFYPFLFTLCRDLRYSESLLIFLRSKSDNARQLLQSFVNSGNLGILDFILSTLHLSDILHHFDNVEDNPLTIAAQLGYASVIELFLRMGLNLSDRPDIRSKTLSCAIMHGSVEVVKLLLSAGFHFEGSIFYAILRKQWNIVLILLDHVVDLSIPDSKGYFILDRVISAGGVEYLDSFLLAGANPNSKSIDGTTPLIRAVFHNSIAAVKLLVLNGADVEICDSSGMSAVEHAGSLEYVEIFRYLLPFSRKDLVRLYQSAGYRGVITDCREQIYEMMDSAIFPTISTPLVAPSDVQDTLFLSCKLGCSRFLSFLDRVGISLEKITSLSTLLRLSISAPTIECALYILKLPVDPNTPAVGSPSPLSLAVLTGRVDIVNALLDHGARVITTDPLVDSPLWLACVKGYGGILLSLMKKCSIIEAVPSLNAVMAAAASSGHTEILEIILGMDGANPNILTKDGFGSPLIAASKKGHLECAEVLLNHGADPRLRTKQGESALTAAAEAGHVQIIQLLLSHGGDVNCQGTYDRTPLAVAAARNHTELIRYLLTVGADKQKADILGDIPLDAAIRGNHEEAVLLLQ